MTGERTLPILDAAHIRPYEEGGEHDVTNGLLLRTDIHRLFDKAYVTISYDGRFEVGSASNRFARHHKRRRPDLDPVRNEITSQGVEELRV